MDDPSNEFIYHRLLNNFAWTCAIKTSFKKDEKVKAKTLDSTRTYSSQSKLKTRSMLN